MKGPLVTILVPKGGTRTISEIPETVKRFVVRHISGVWQLELLLLFKESNKPLSAGDAARILYQSTDVLAAAIKRFAASQILMPCPNEPNKFIYAPKSEEMRQAIDETDRTYATRRIAVINLIFSRPLTSFSEAFRITTEGED